MVIFHQAKDGSRSGDGPRVVRGWSEDGPTSGGPSPVRLRPATRHGAPPPHTGGTIYFVHARANSDFFCKFAAKLYNHEMAGMVWKNL